MTPMARDSEKNIWPPAVASTVMKLGSSAMKPPSTA